MNRLNVGVRIAIVFSKFVPISRSNSPVGGIREHISLKTLAEFTAR